MNSGKQGHTENNQCRTVDEFLQEAHDNFDKSQQSQCSCRRWKYGRILFAMGMANCGDATEIACMGYILSNPTFQEEVLQNDFKGRGATFTSMVFLGMLLGGLLTGATSDTHSVRKSPLLLGLTLNSIAGILSAFLPPNITLLSACRFFSGVGVGTVIASLYPLATELCAPKVRGRYVTIVSSFWTVGAVYVAVCGWWLLRKELDHNDGRESVSNGEAGSDVLWNEMAAWRIFVFVCALPPTLGLILVWVYVPESPRILALRGCYNQAVVNANEIAASMGQGTRTNMQHTRARNPSEEQRETILREGFRWLTIEEVAHIYTKNNSHAASSMESEGDMELTQIAQQKQQEGEEELQLLTNENDVARAPEATTRNNTNKSSSRLPPPQATCWKNWIPLFTHPRIRSISLPLQVLWIVLSFGAGLCTWTVQLFAEMNMSSIYTNALVLALSNIPGHIAAATLLDKIGRRRMVNPSMLVAALSLVSFAWAAARAPRDSATTQNDTSDGHGETLANVYYTMALVSMCMFHASLVASWNSLSVITSEILPTKIRSTGTGLCVALGRFAGILAQVVNGRFIDRPQVLVLIAACALLLGVGVVGMSGLTGGNGVDGKGLELVDELDVAPAGEKGGQNLPCDKVIRDDHHTHFQETQQSFKLEGVDDKDSKSQEALTGDSKGARRRNPNLELV